MTIAVALTPLQLAQATGASLLRATPRLPAYMQAMTAYAINTRLRIAFLLANVGVESGGFQFHEEIWGPTDAQRGYEGRLDLGNAQPGDGYRFRGRGDMDTTGRKNYAALTLRLRKRFPLLQVPDFEADPDKLSEPQWAALSACDYVDMAGCNPAADAMNFDSYCDLVNRGHVTPKLGDANGFARRLELALIGLRVLP